MQVGFFKLLKHLGSLIRFFRLYVAVQNAEIMGFEVSALKSPRTIKLSCFDK